MPPTPAQSHWQTSAETPKTDSKSIPVTHRHGSVLDDTAAVQFEVREHHQEVLRHRGTYGGSRHETLQLNSRGRNQIEPARGVRQNQNRLEFTTESITKPFQTPDFGVARRAKFHLSRNPGSRLVRKRALPKTENRKPRGNLPQNAGSIPCA